MRDAKGLSAEQMNEFRASFNHFDRVSFMLNVFYWKWLEFENAVISKKIIKILSFIQDQDGVITAEELQGCLTAIGHIVESNDPARVNLTPRPSLRSLFPLPFYGS